MKKIMSFGIMLLTILLVTSGCGCSKKSPESNNQNNNSNENFNENSSVIKDNVFEGFEFLNTGVANGQIETIVINNTGVFFEGSDFKMTIKDSEGNIIAELTDTVGPMDFGTTKTVVTKTDVDLSKAAVIQYNIIID